MGDTFYGSGGVFSKNLHVWNFSISCHSNSSTNFFTEVPFGDTDLWALKAKIVEQTFIVQFNSHSYSLSTEQK